MTLDHPLWLLLLIAGPALWWMHRRLRAPREVMVASVEPLRGAQLEPSGARPRRTPDLDLVLLLSAVVVLAFAAAGPRWGSGTPAMLVAVDTSASMLARTPTGETIGDVAWERVHAHLMALLPDLDVVVVDLDAPGAETRSAVSDAVPPRADPMRADALPGALAPILARARAERFPGVLLVTDRSLESTPGVVTSGPGVAPLPRPELVDVVLDGAGARVTVERVRESACILRVSGPALAAAEWPVPSGEGLVVIGAIAPPRGQRATYELIVDGGRETTTLEVQRVGGVGAVRLVQPAGGAPRVGALLATLGVRIVNERLAAVDAEVFVGGPPAPLAGDDPPRLHFAAGVGQVAGVEVLAAGPQVAADRITSSGVLAAAVPAPGVAMIRSGVIEPSDAEAAGEWRAPDGTLAVARSRWVATTLDPESSASGWHRDPSFPVFVLAAFEHLVGGGDRLEILNGTPSSERRRRDAAPAVVEGDRLPALVRPPALDPASTSAGAALAAAGAALLLVVTLRHTGRLTGRFSSVGRR